VNQTTGKVIIHATYFALHSILIEHWSCLNTELPASTAGKAMLFCVVYSLKKMLSCLVVSAYLA